MTIETRVERLESQVLALMAHKVRAMSHDGLSVRSIARSLGVKRWFVKGLLDMEEEEEE